MSLFETISQKPHLIQGYTPAKQVEIPKTSKENYITGIYAMNISDDTDTTGDWHDVFHFREDRDKPRIIDTAGTDSSYSTNEIYGDMGIYEGQTNIKRKGLKLSSDISEVWIADHYRAILDMVYHSLKKYNKVLNLNGATDDWIDTPEQKQFVLSQAAQMERYLSKQQQEALNNWIDYEYKNSLTEQEA